MNKYWWSNLLGTEVIIINKGPCLHRAFETQARGKKFWYLTCNGYSLLDQNIGIWGIILPGISFLHMSISKLWWQPATQLFVLLFLSISFLIKDTMYNMLEPKLCDSPNWVYFRSSLAKRFTIMWIVQLTDINLGSCDDVTVCSGCFMGQNAANGVASTKFIFWRPEVWNQGVGRFGFFLKAEGEWVPHLSPSSVWLSLTYRCIIQSPFSSLCGILSVRVCFCVHISSFYKNMLYWTKSHLSWLHLNSIICSHPISK